MGTIRIVAEWAVSAVALLALAVWLRNQPWRDRLRRAPSNLGNALRESVKTFGIGALIAAPGALASAYAFHVPHWESTPYFLVFGFGNLAAVIGGGLMAWGVVVFVGLLLEGPPPADPLKRMLDQKTYDTGGYPAHAELHAALLGKSGMTSTDETMFDE